MKSKLLAKAFAFLDLACAAEEPLSLKDAAKSLKLSAATASRVGSDLVEAGLLRKSGYRSFEPALGLLHLGQRALLRNVFPKKALRLVSSRCRAEGLDGALAGVFKDRLVYFFNSSHDERRPGLPYVNQPFNSNIALVSLCVSQGRERALAVLKKSLLENGDGRPEAAAAKSYSERLDALEREGFSFLDGGSFWNACVPLKWRGEAFGLALYASPEAARSKARLVSEAFRLRSDVEELLLNS